MATPAPLHPPAPWNVLRSLDPRSGLPHHEPAVIPLGAEAIDASLPDGGLPRGVVVELAAPRTLGQATSLALRACASAQQQALLRAGEPAWCGWLDPTNTLFAPGAAALGVFLQRLLVVRPPLDSLARIAVRMVSSRVFSVLVIDAVGVPGACAEVPLHRWPNVVRRLAIAAQGGDTSVVLLTDCARSRDVGLPVAMRVELEQPDPSRLRLQIAKERHGRIDMPHELAYARYPAAHEHARCA